MKKLPLLPHTFQKIGFILFVPMLALGIANVFFDFEISWLSYTVPIHARNGFGTDTSNYTDELAAVGNILTMMLMAFSKERTEDEAIQFFRLASLQWAVILNYIILIICILFVYGFGFVTVMMYNMFTVLIIFNLRFRFILFRYNKASV